MSYETIDKKKFLPLTDSLKEYKTYRKANWSNSSINIDVNNYIYIFDLRKISKGSSFVDIADYIISADGNLCEWGKEILPSVIPIAVLPSVWHSLLLKFKGRTNEDYKAFTLFLNLRYRTTNKDFDERLPRILELVQSLNEPIDLKNLVLEEISENLITKYNDIKEVPELVEKAKNEIIERETNKIYESEGRPLIDQGKVAGRLAAFYEIAENNAEKIITRRNKVLKFINWFKLSIGIMIIIWVFCAVMLFGIGVISKSFKKEFFGYDIFNWTTIIGILLTSITYFIINPIKLMYEKQDFEKLKDKEFKRLTNGKNLTAEIKYELE